MQLNPQADMTGHLCSQESRRASAACCARLLYASQQMPKLGLECKIAMGTAWLAVLVTTSDQWLIACKV